MIANVFEGADTPRQIELSPICGDYCDSCGDCLYCFREDACGGIPDREHAWVVYPDQRDEFRERYGLSGGVS